MEAMRSLILDDVAWRRSCPGFAVVAGLAALMLALARDRSPISDSDSRDTARHGVSARSYRACA
jgi:hypothetical protein